MTAGALERERAGGRRGSGSWGDPPQQGWARRLEGSGSSRGGARRVAREARSLQMCRRAARRRRGLDVRAESGGMSASEVRVARGIGVRAVRLGGPRRCGPRKA